jgi:GNAT superfamily N-acetyltransferase
VRIYQLPDGMQKLAEESSRDGFRNMKRLLDDYSNGTNRFDKLGEALFSAYIQDQVVGICGLNRDLSVSDETVGRVRRLYVLQDFRRLGVGRLLMQAVVEEAGIYFDKLILFNDNPIADRFYRSIGFTASKDAGHFTHELKLRT